MDTEAAPVHLDEARASCAWSFPGKIQPEKLPQSARKMHSEQQPDSSKNKRLYPEKKENLFTENARIRNIPTVVGSCLTGNAETAQARLLLKTYTGGEKKDPCHVTGNIKSHPYTDAESGPIQKSWAGNDF